jgi:MscS family membrane protein
MINAVKDPFGYFILIQGFYIAIIYLQLPKNIGPFEIDPIIRAAHILSISFVTLYFIFRIIDIVALYINKKVKDDESTIDKQIAPLIIKILRILVVVVGILSMLSNFGYNTTSLVTGLGIGGLAMALAAQTTLSNLFGSVAIFSDKPFRIGDRIQIGDVDGIIEEIGLRTTNIRRLDQALAIVPNSMFINQEIINYSAMKKRKIEFYIGITYDTPVHKIKDAVAGVQDIIEKNEKFEHCSHIVRLANFGASSLDIYVYCFTHITDYAEFHVVKETLILEIIQALEKLDVELAFPSQTIYLHRTANIEYKS